MYTRYFGSVHTWPACRYTGLVKGKRSHEQNQIFVFTSNQWSRCQNKNGKRSETIRLSKAKDKPTDYQNGCEMFAATVCSRNTEPINSRFNLVNSLRVHHAFYESLQLKTSVKNATSTSWLKRQTYSGILLSYRDIKLGDCRVELL